MSNERYGRFPGEESKNNKGPKKNPSDSIVVLKEKYPELAQKLPENKNFNPFESWRLGHGSETANGPARPATFILPESYQPLVDVKIIGHGGGRSIGGGTGREARQRAKKKERRSTAKNKKSATD